MTVRRLSLIKTSTQQNRNERNVSNHRFTISHQHYNTTLKAINLIMGHISSINF